MRLSSCPGSYGAYGPSASEARPASSAERPQRGQSKTSGTRPLHTGQIGGMAITPSHRMSSRHNFILLLWPGDSFAVGSMYTFALLMAVGASPKPTAISFSLPG